MKNVRPTKGAKRISEMTASERKAVADYCDGAHPSNIPESMEDAWWTFDKEGRAGWLAGYIF